MILANVLMWMTVVYLGAGCVFAVCFLARGIELVDPATHATPATFKLLVFPGLAAFWPIMLRKWRTVGIAASGNRATKQEPMP